MEHLAPCGLDCTRCPDYTDGETRELASMLQECLGDYERRARLKSDTIPVFAGWSQFAAILDYFSRASCCGCRSKENHRPFDCRAATCAKKHGVDYCFACKEFPCDGGDPWALTPAGERWKKNNERMRDLGVQAFFMEQELFPR